MSRRKRFKKWLMVLPEEQVMMNKAIKRTLVFILVLCIAQILVGCATLTRVFTPYGKLEKTARDHYAAGRYDTAVFDCAKSLKLNPEYEEAQILIQDAFRAASNAHERKIKTLKSSLAKFKWDDIVSHYNSLVRINETIMGLPTLRNKETKEVIKFELTDYTADLADAKKNAAEVHYQEGLRLSKKEGIDIQKQAAKEFKKAMSFSPGYKDAEALYEKSRRAGIKRMAIIPFVDKSGKMGKYGALSDMITDDIISSVMNNPSATEFLEIVSRTELQRVMQEQQLGLTGLIDAQTAAKVGEILGVHEILTGHITQIIYTPPRPTKRSEKQKENVVIRKEKYRDKEGKEHTRNIWGDVYATVTFYKKITKATISGSYKTIDVKTAKLKKSESFSGDADFTVEWATYSGDKRALNRHAKNLIKKFEEPAPVEEEMVNRAAKNLSKSLSNTLIEYAR